MNNQRIDENIRELAVKATNRIRRAQYILADLIRTDESNEDHYRNISAFCNFLQAELKGVAQSVRN
ncbi:MAG: hypothetical protein PHW04_15090 [Candidatus Wallbacteria bacterium]|nr:hypothetical protein [Candidatus Wallbacteria bacterium]